MVVESKTATDRLESCFPTIIEEDSNCRPKRERSLLGRVQIRKILIVGNLDRRSAVESSATYTNVNVHRKLSNGETAKRKYEESDQKEF